METKQITTTVIEAAEGKVLRRKSDGVVYGTTVHLGYNYYEGGMPSRPSVDTPDDFEEVDAPEDYAAFDVTDRDRLVRMSGVIARERLLVNGYGLTASDALETKDWFPVWGKDIVDGTELAKGFRFQYTAAGEEDSTLYEVVQTHTAQMQYAPGLSTAALYKVVNVDASGTKDDPIAYVPPMEIFSGRYYTQGGALYLCTRDSGQALSHDLAALVGVYVETVEQED